MYLYIYACIYILIYIEAHQSESCKWYVATSMASLTESRMKEAPYIYLYLYTYTYIPKPIYLYIHACIYILIYIEAHQSESCKWYVAMSMGVNRVAHEGDALYTYTYIHIHISIHIYIYIYACIKRERSAPVRVVQVVGGNVDGVFEVGSLYIYLYIHTYTYMHAFYVCKYIYM